MAPTCNLHTGGFLGPWAGFLIYRRQGRKNIKKIRKMLELEGRLEKGQEWGRTLTAIEGESAVRVSRLVAGAFTC